MYGLFFYEKTPEHNVQGLMILFIRVRLPYDNQRQLQ